MILYYCIHCNAVVILNYVTKIHTCSYCKKQYTVEDETVYEIIPVQPVL